MSRPCCRFPSDLTHITAQLRFGTTNVDAARLADNVAVLVAILAADAAVAVASHVMAAGVTLCKPVQTLSASGNTPQAITVVSFVYAR